MSLQRCIPGVIRGERVQVQAFSRQLFGQVADKLGILLARLVQLGALAQGLVVGGEGHGLGLLHLEPVHCHLEEDWTGERGIANGCLLIQTLPRQL